MHTNCFGLFFFLPTRKIGVDLMAWLPLESTWWWFWLISMTSWFEHPTPQRCAPPASLTSAWKLLCPTTAAWHRPSRWSSADAHLDTRDSPARSIFFSINFSDFSFFFLFTWLCLNQVCVIFRTVLLAIPAPVVACTWVTVSSVNAMVTLTPVTRRPASVQYEAPDQLMIGIFLWIKASWQDL